jgi:hypothetical protein
MKYFYVYICLAVLVVSALIYIISELYIVKKVTVEELEREAKKREEIVKEIDLLKSEKKDLDLSIENMKRYVDKKEQGLLVNIQAIKNKGNVQVRNVTDSSIISLLKELQPN